MKFIVKYPNVGFEWINEFSRVVRAGFLESFVVCKIFL